jgi:iron complex transport system ATP-binding protein
MTSLLDAKAVAMESRLRPTSLRIGSGELVALIGPNGGGKTSLLRALADVERSAGTVLIDGEDLSETAAARRPHLLTFLPASREIAWPIAARDVIALGLPAPDRARVDDLIGLLELERFADRRIDHLSTGERARVLLARALGPGPKLLLLDEPLSNLDPYWVLRLLEILREFVAAGASALVALHDIDRLPDFDRALLMASGALKADLQAAEMLESSGLVDAFGIERSSCGWKIRREDRQSSP